jgi:hypothetical protein
LPLHDDESSYDDISGASDPNRFERPGLIRLQRSERGDLLVNSPDVADPPTAFPSFPFPRLPLSLHCWLTGLGAEFRRRHGRCVAALLVLDCHEARWVSPVLPSQTCGQEGSAWTLDLGGQTLLSGHRIGGSFQMRAAGDVMEAAETVPRFDGLHIVQTLQEHTSMAYCFLHSQGEIAVLPAEEALEDDWAAALAQAAPRMSLE